GAGPGGTGGARGRSPGSGRRAGGSALHRLRSLIRSSEPRAPAEALSSSPATSPPAGRPEGRTGLRAGDRRGGGVRDGIETNADDEEPAVDAQALGAR